MGTTEISKGRFMQSKAKWLPAIVALTVAAGTFQTGGLSQAQGNSQTFPQTGKTVKGIFLNYWSQNGALPQQGYPITEEFQQRSDTDGKTYTMQCFERAVFENHPENVGKPSEVLLSLLGNFYYKQRYQFGAPANQRASTINPRKFTETGKTIGGKFRAYWEANGGLAQQGFPITEEFEEKNQTDGKTYTVQYFERAVFELHPENAGTQYEVLLTLLGKFMCPANKPAPAPTTVVPTPTPDPNFDPTKQYRLSTQFRGDGMCLASTSDNKYELSLQACKTVQFQHFRITRASGDTWKLALDHGGFTQCLDTGRMAPCTNASGQFWIIKPRGGGYYTMTNTFTGPTKCLDINPTNNQPRMADCGNFSGQDWKFTEVK